MQNSDSYAYDAEPCYPPVGGDVGTGWDAAAAALPPGGIVLAVDGPAVAGWDHMMSAVFRSLAATGRKVSLLDMRTRFAPWEKVLAATAYDTLAEDPDFAALETRSMADYFDELPVVSRRPESVLVVFGPGAALVEHDVLWYADLPKRYAEAAITAGQGLNLAQPAGRGPGTTRRLFYIDWPVLDRHRDAIAADIDLWIDTQAPDRPRWLDGTALRRTLSALSARPFRTRPTFNTTPWGGQLGAEDARPQPGPAQFRPGIRTDRPRERRPHRRARRPAARGPRSRCWSPSTPSGSWATRCTRCSAPRSRSASTTWTRSAAATCPCTATRSPTT